jgi:hypothetical protein
MNKKAWLFWLVILLSIFVGLCIQSYYNAECIKYSFDRAVITVQGVFCFVDRVELVHPYMFLRDIVEREKHKCESLQCDPRFTPKYDTDQW